MKTTHAKEGKDPSRWWDVQLNRGGCIANISVSYLKERDWLIRRSTRFLDSVWQDTSTAWLITAAEITLSLLGMYRRTCGLVGVDVVKIFGNGVKIAWNGKNREGSRESEISATVINQAIDVSCRTKCKNRVLLLISQSFSLRWVMEVLAVQPPLFSWTSHHLDGSFPSFAWVVLIIISFLFSL